MSDNTLPELIEKFQKQRKAPVFKCLRLQADISLRGETDSIKLAKGDKNIVIYENLGKNDNDEYFSQLSTIKTYVL